jgi:YD repeat-containing protein
VTAYPDHTTSITMYDALGRQASVTDQFTHTTQYAYDLLGRLYTVTTPGGHAETFGYDELGEKVSQTDANGHTTAFAYDLRGHLVSRQLPAHQAETFQYDADGVRYLRGRVRCSLNFDTRNSCRQAGADGMGSCADLCREITDCNLMGAVRAD